MLRNIFSRPWVCNTDFIPLTTDDDDDDDDDELDSDDDLQPYNIDEEDESNTCVNGVRAPVHLRECMSGLISSNDANRMEGTFSCSTLSQNPFFDFP